MEQHQQLEEEIIADDVRTLHRMGYAQELARCLNGFSNFAISLSIICILAGGLTSFSLGFCSVGGAAIGIGWPLMCLLSLAVAATMGQIASSFPTAGGLYHWAAILGGRGWGWGTAWFNLAGLVTALAAINVGAFRFAAAAFSLDWADSYLGAVARGWGDHLFPGRHQPSGNSCHPRTYRLQRLVDIVRGGRADDRSAGVRAFV